ncbi:AAA family ATPase [Candidatus Fermentibacteria bacterium]|nr:AAA family ATPase [Candidatus Fermentibacteria bacterium]
MRAQRRAGTERMAQGIFVAGAKKDAGKTTLSLGLIHHLRSRIDGGVSFTKPLGQKTTIVDDTAAGQDSWFVDKALDLNLDLEYTAPFSASSGAATEYIVTGEPGDILRRIKRAYRHLGRKSGLVVVEGTGHPGVGSVFNLSNASVAKVLDLPVILVLDGGIGRTIDMFSLCRSLFEQQQVRILGVVVNRVIPSKMDKISSILGKWFEKAGVRIFGMIPFERRISTPSLGVISRTLDASPMLSMSSIGIHRVSGYLTAFGSSDEVVRNVRESPESALLVSANRRDVLDSLFSRKLAGEVPEGPGALILCGSEGNRYTYIHSACEKLSIPLYRTEGTVAGSAYRLESRVFKVEPDEREKIEAIIDLVGTHVDIDAILHELAVPPAEPRKKATGLQRFLGRSVRFFEKLFGPGEDDTETEDTAEEER